MTDILVVLGVSAIGALGYLIAGPTGAAWAIFVGGSVAILSWILWPDHKKR